MQRVTFSSNSKLCAHRQFYALPLLQDKSKKYNSLSAEITIKCLDGLNSDKMEKVRSIPELPISRDCGPTKEDIKKFDHLRDVPIASMDQLVCLLIGADTPEAFFHLEERQGNRRQPIAIKDATWMDYSRAERKEAARQSSVIS